MDINNIEVGDPVIYFSKYMTGLPKEQVEKKENLGVVKSKNNDYAFVEYSDNTHTQATHPDNLYTLKNRPDLMAYFGPSTLEEMVNKFSLSENQVMMAKMYFDNKNI